MDSSSKEENSEQDLEDEYNWSSRYINFDEIESIDNRVGPGGSPTYVPLDKINEPHYSFAELKAIQTNDQVHIPHKIIGSGLAYAIPHKAVYSKDNYSEGMSVNRNEIEFHFEEPSTADTPGSSEPHDVENGRKKSGSCRSTFMITTIIILVVIVISLSITVTLLVLKPEFLIQISDTTIAPTDTIPINTTVSTKPVSTTVKPLNPDAKCPKNDQNQKNIFAINGIFFMVKLQASQGQVENNMICSKPSSPRRVI